METIHNAFFVYGTLMTGERNHVVISDYDSTLEVIPAISTEMDMYLHPCGAFPFVVHGTGIVHGEIIIVDPEQYDEILTDVDYLEGYREDGLKSSNLYNRIEIIFNLPDGRRISASTYIANEPDFYRSRRITNGKWKDYLKSEKELTS